MIHIHEHCYKYFEEVNEGILRNVPQQSGNTPLVLDVGCGSGALSAEIALRGYRVWGIESNPEAAAIAADRIEKVLVVDLCEMEAVRRNLGEQTFDYLIFSDVLEHLYDPFLILKNYVSLLNRGGYLLVSVPNIAVWTNRFGLLFGRFNYTDTGILDRTHIRHFTYKSAKQIVSEAGCEIIKLDFTPYFLRSLLPLVKKFYADSEETSQAGNRQIVDSKGYKLYMRYIYPLERAAGKLRMQLFAFRIVVVGRKK